MKQPVRKDFHHVGVDESIIGSGSGSTRAGHWQKARKLRRVARSMSEGLVVHVLRSK